MRKINKYWLERDSIGPDGFNKYGFGQDGYDRSGYDFDGYDRKGFNRDGYDRDGFDRDGYDEFGIDRRGFDKYGDDARFPFRDNDGYDREGFDQDGYNRQGYDRYGYTREEVEKETALLKEHKEACERWKEEQYEEDLNSTDFHVDYERIAYGYCEDDEVNEYGIPLYEDDPFEDGPPEYLYPED